MHSAVPARPDSKTSARDLFGRDPVSEGSQGSVQLKRAVAGRAGFDAQSAALAPPSDRAPVQRKSSRHADASVQALAARGTEGGGSELPFADQIQQSFGGHDVSAVRAHTGSEATAAATAMGAEAFATGHNVAFAGSPTLHNAAHEAAHVVQQQAGVQLPGGVGQAGDAYERHADEVADAVVRGESAAPLLDACASAGGPSSDAVQRKGGDGYVELTDTGVKGALSREEQPGGSREQGASEVSVSPGSIDATLAAERTTAKTEGEGFQHTLEDSEHVVTASAKRGGDREVSYTRGQQRDEAAVTVGDREATRVRETSSGTVRAAREDGLTKVGVTGRRLEETTEERVGGERVASRSHSRTAGQLEASREGVEGHLLSDKRTFERDGQSGSVGVTLGKLSMDRAKGEASLTVAQIESERSVQLSEQLTGTVSATVKALSAEVDGQVARLELVSGEARATALASLPADLSVEVTVGGKVATGLKVPYGELVKNPRAALRGMKLGLNAEAEIKIAVKHGENEIWKAGLNRAGEVESAADQDGIRLAATAIASAISTVAMEQSDALKARGGKALERWKTSATEAMEAEDGDGMDGPGDEDQLLARALRRRPSDAPSPSETDASRDSGEATGAPEPTPASEPGQAPQQPSEAPVSGGPGLARRALDAVRDRTHVNVAPAYATGKAMGPLNASLAVGRDGASASLGLSDGAREQVDAATKLVNFKKTVTLFEGSVNIGSEPQRVKLTGTVSGFIGADVQAQASARFGKLQAPNGKLDPGALEGATGFRLSSLATGELTGTAGAFAGVKLNLGLSASWAWQKRGWQAYRADALKAIALRWPTLHAGLERLRSYFGERVVEQALGVVFGFWGEPGEVPLAVVEPRGWASAGLGYSLGGTASFQGGRLKLGGHMGGTFGLGGGIGVDVTLDVLQAPLLTLTGAGQLVTDPWAVLPSPSALSGRLWGALGGGKAPQEEAPAQEAAQPPTEGTPGPTAPRSRPGGILAAMTRPPGAMRWPTVGAAVTFGPAAMFPPGFDWAAYLSGQAEVPEMTGPGVDQLD
jgi:hypothetical protein